MAGKKIPIGDVTVLLVLAFGFGVLAAWALFFAWGSAPQPKPVDMAAWTQAVGSILAILAAVVVAAWQNHQSLNRERRRENARALVAASLAITDIHEMAFEVLILGFVGIEPDTEGSLKEAMQATQIPDALRRLMDVAHEFPDESGPIVRYFTAASEAHQTAQTLLQRYKNEEIARSELEGLFKKLVHCAAEGETLVNRLNRLIARHSSPNQSS
ncbi:hypothetical protein [Stenotrophomonas maltophilia]|uniref:hypothetical protein n=1 Tax=Stenotrophomonas maltophilia TaxID=40324 RepID=UPI001D101704|nr:hypothetical protein [Stenotrophomonas maltophilia]UXB37713.1 hypothetical protein K7563_08060 [Stenotrophomonas maltophilia]